MASGLLSYSLLARRLPTSAFADWLALTSLLGLLSFADLGIGPGLLSRLAEANRSPNKSELRILLSSGLCILVFVGAAFLAIAFAIVRVTGLSKQLLHAADGRNQLLLVLAVISAGVPLALGLCVLSGLQRGALGNTLLSVANVVCLIFLVFTTGRTHSVGLLAALAISAGPLAGLVALAILLRKAAKYHGALGAERALFPHNGGIVGSSFWQ
jgi:O-antigen/teichoic acid export membrane protein